MKSDLPINLFEDLTVSSMFFCQFRVKKHPIHKPQDTLACLIQYSGKNKKAKYKERIKTKLRLLGFDSISTSLKA